MKSQQHRLPVVLLGALLLVMLLAAPARAVTVVDANHHFSYVLPRGWSAYPAADLAKYNKGRTTWIRGAEGPRGGHFLVMADSNLSRTGPAGIPEFRNELESPNCTVESVTWDAQRSAYVARIALTSAGQVVHILIFAFPGDTERIALFCYPPETDLSPIEADLNRLADSFTFDTADGAASPRAPGG